MLDGYVILGDTHVTAELYHRILRVPKSVLETMFYVALGLHKRQSQAMEAVESYCFESTSRFRWTAFKNGPVSSHAGIPGAEKLGLNSVQQMWAVYNEIEDIRNREESLWEGLKLVASASAPKGVKQLDAADKRRRAADRDRRQSLMDKFYYTQIGYLLEGKAPKDGPQFIQQSKTVEDLEKEMYDWVVGNEDWHDKIINAYKREVVAKFEKEKAEARARAEALAKAEKEESGGSPPLVGYAPDVLMAMLRERDQGRGGTRMIYDDPQRESVYRKYVIGQPDSGRLRAVGGRLVVTDGPSPTGEPEPTDEPVMPEMEY